MPRKKNRTPLHKPLPRPNVDAAKRAAWEASHSGDTRIGINPDREVDASTAWWLRGADEFEQLHAELLDKARVVGYLRIVPEIDGQGSHWMLKFTRGLWRGHYLYFFQRPQDPARMACLFLMRHFDEVQAGTRKPAKDSPWGA